MRTIVRVVVATVVGSLVVAGAAEAGCNAIPSTDMLSSANPALARAAVVGGSNVSRFGFKGALGRVDQLYLLPGDSRSVNVVPDGLCIAPGSERQDPGCHPFEPTDDLVTLFVLHTSDGRQPIIRAYASKSMCDQLVPAADQLKTRGSGTMAIELKTCSQDARVDGARLTIPLPLPEEFGARGVDTSTSIRIVSTHTGASRDALAGLLQRAATQPCRDSCADLIKTGGQVCIDDIYFAATIDADGKATWAQDPVPCTEQYPNVPTNDFAKACDDESTATSPKCDQKFPDLTMWQDPCGGVHIPFIWTGIRPAPKTRVVRGRR